MRPILSFNIMVQMSWPYVSSKMFNTKGIIYAKNQVKCLVTYTRSYRQVVRWGGRQKAHVQTLQNLIFRCGLCQTNQRPNNFETNNPSREIG